MIHIYPTEKIRQLDQYTILHEPIRSIDLVERASTRFVDFFIRHYNKAKHIHVFAGPGNNGADALAIARILMEHEYRVDTYLFNTAGKLSEECEVNRQRLLERRGDHFKEIISNFDPPYLDESDIVIDGLFGSGLNRPLSGGFAGVVRFLNDSPAKIVSIDIPSGLFSEDNSSNDPDAIIQASRTITFDAPKLSFFFQENRKYTGDWHSVEIGIHPNAKEEITTPYVMITEMDIERLLHSRKRFSNKGDYGHALLIAGSSGKFGAGILAAKGCLRSGVGLLTLHAPSSAEQIYQTAVPEAMLSFDVNPKIFSSIPNVKPYSAIGVGPGLGMNMDSSTALDRLFSAYNRPIVVDADAINLLSSDLSIIEKIPQESILTPHPKEFDRLVGSCDNSYERLSKAIEWAKKYTINIVLKGAFTATITSEGNVCFNSTGNPALATAGTGDVLTGIITGLLAQGYHPPIAALIGVFVHGMAADLYVQKESEVSMIATDVTHYLSKAFRSLRP